MPKETFKHHYIPEFYLKRWAWGDRRLVVFAHGYQGLHARLKTPAQTGYEFKLYSSDALAPEQRDHVERNFMAPLDNIAAKVSERFINTAGEYVATKEQRDGWSRFVMSLMHRTPRGVAYIKEEFAKTFDETPYKITENDRIEYENVKRNGGPDSIEEYMILMRAVGIELGAVKLIQTLSDSPKIGTHINGMFWRIITFSGKQRRLLTSDQPLTMSGGFGNPDAFLMVALSPRHLWVGTNAHATMQRIIAKIESGEVVYRHNLAMCQFAHKYVYGSTKGEVGFVRKHFATKAEPRTVVEQLRAEVRVTVTG